MRPLKGLHRDFQLYNQPEDSLRFALNSIGDAFDGGIGSMSSEPGNTLCVELEREIIGAIPIADNEFAIFSVGDGISEIGLLKNCNYTSVVESNCLNFSKEYPIKGVARVKNCDRIVYWNDCNNNDRYFNFDNKEAFLLESATIPGESNWDCDLFDIIPSFNPFSVEYVQTSKGSLPKGTYAFAFAYEDQDGNRTDFFSFTDGITVDDNKSITFEFTGVDTSYSFIRPAIIAFNVDDVTAVVNLLDSIPVSDTTSTYKVSNITGIETVLADVNIPSSRFIKSKAMDIVNKRLVRGNLTGEEIDWSIFQQQVNNAEVKWVAKLDERYISTSEGEQNIIIDKSLRRDEIYDIGIVYVFDGFESPVFSIPGRETITDGGLIATGNTNEDIRSITAGGNFDTTNVTVVAHTGAFAGTDEIDEYDVQHLGLAVGDTIERWKIYNTAIEDEGLNDNRGYWAFGGFCGYYEDENQQYPESFGDLEGVNVRYHRMPTLSMCPVHKDYFELFLPTDIQNKQFVHQLGLEVYNVNIPADYADKVLGYRIVYSKIENPTVVDTGLIERVTFVSGATGTNDDFATQSVPFHLSDDDGLGYVLTNPLGEQVVQQNMGFYSVDSKFLSLEDADYMSPQFVLEGSINTVFGSGTFTAPDFGGERYLLPLLGKHEITSSTYREITDQKSIGINTVTLFNGSTFLNAGKQEYDVLAINQHPLFDTNGTFSFQEPYALASTTVGYAITQLKKLVTPLSNRYATRFIPFNGEIYTANIQDVFGGDTYIVDFAFRKTQRTMSDEEMPGTGNTGVLFDEVTSILRFFTEASINANFRNEGTGFFTASNGDQQEANLFWPGTLGLDEFLKREPEYRNYYDVESSVSVTNFWKEYIPLSASYEFDETCSSYPNLLAYSEQSEDTDLADKFRVFRPNNLGLIPENRGPITNLSFYRQKLLAFTDQSLFQLLPNPQQIETDVSTIYIGTAEFLSVPPKELVESEWGHAGTSGRFNIKSTPYGLFYIDIDQGRVYRFYDQLEDISAKGLHNFFQENRDFLLVEDYEETFNQSYPFEDNTLLTSGVGIRTVYDPYFERFILTKIDKKALFPLNNIEYCVPYPLVKTEDTFLTSDYTIGSGNPFPYDINNTVVIPPGLYDMFSSGAIPFDPNTGYNGDSTMEFARIYPHIQMAFPVSVSTLGQTGPFNSYTPLFQGTDWTNGNTLIQMGFGNTFFYDSNGNLLTDGFTIGDAATSVPFIRFPDLLGFTGATDISLITSTFERQYLGMFYDVPAFGKVMYSPQLDPQLPNSGVGFFDSLLGSWQLTAQFSLAPDDFPRFGLISPSVKEDITKNPFTERVVDYRVTSDFGLLNFPSRSYGWVWPNQRRHVIGFVTPETDTWDLTNGMQVISWGHTTPPEIYMSINEGAQIINPIITLASVNPLGNIYEVVFTETLTLNKGDTVDIIFNNVPDNDLENYEDLYLIFTFGELSLVSTTQLERIVCDYVSPDEVYTIGVYDGFDIEGYPVSATIAANKIPHLEDPLYWVEFYVDNETVNITAGNTTNISSAVDTVTETGVYELYTNDFILEFTTENHGAANYTITLDYEGTTLATFDYEPTLSAINGYDTFKAVWSGVTHLTMVAGTSFPEINVTVNLTDLTSANANSLYSAYTRMSNAVQTIKFNACDSFIIRNYDSLTSIAEGSLQAFGADYVISLSGEERLLNFVKIPEDGVYDIHINNDFDVTDPNVAFTIYINDVVQVPILEFRDDGTGFLMTLKDVTLSEDDQIKVTVTDAFHNPSIFSDEYLTTLVKKDYTCIDILPTEDKSYTISYDVKNGNWASYHSYLPRFEFNDSKWYYTTENLTSIYKHEVNNYLSFYDNLYPHVLEFVVKAPLTTILNSIKWVGNVQQYNENFWIEVDDISFDQMLVYNDRQSTGLQTLDFNQSSVFWDNTTKKIIKRNKEFRVGGIRNLATGQPLVTKEGTTRSVDLISNDSVIDINRSLNLQDPLRSNYHTVRLYYNPTSADIRLITNIVETLNQYSFG